jgi:polyribonucleotide nucleotidyltransferase
VELDYLPLKVDYEEKFYAAGKILGSRYVRREGRSSEEAILAGRLVDRTIRPLFNNNMRREIQVVVTVLQIDEQNDPEFVGLLGVSTALFISDIPWGGPVAGVRVAQKTDDKQFVINPDNSAVVEPNVPIFDAFVSGSKDRINMIELGGLDAQESDVVAGFKLAQTEINKLIAFQEQIQKEIGKPKAEVAIVAPDADIKAEVQTFLADKLEDAIYKPTKVEHTTAVGALNHALNERIKEKFGTVKEKINWKGVEALFEEMVNQTVHKNVLEHDRRPDGRKLDEVRALDAEVGLFSRTHGSVHAALQLPAILGW